MNLISCNCGTVLDKSKLNFSKDKHLADGSVDKVARKQQGESK